MSDTSVTIADRADSQAEQRAVQHLLRAAREAAARGRSEEAADLLSAADPLPTLVGDPPAFRQALDRVARRHPAAAPALAALDRHAARRLRADDPWHDCGAAD
jgi:hypothetical protein